MKKLLLVIGVILSFFLLTSGYINAEEICGCANKFNGKLRILKDNSECRKWENKICWGSGDCPITVEEFDALIARIELLESFAFHRFTDMGDGTIRDNTTRLIWLKNANAFGKMNWYDAVDAVANLSSGEHGLTDGSVNGDWQLPTYEQLHSLVNLNYTYPALCNTIGDGQWSEGDAFTGVQSDYYWTSNEIDTMGEPAAVNIYFGNGEEYYDWKLGSAHVWPVRSSN